MVIKECLIKAIEILRASGTASPVLDARVLIKFVLSTDDVYILTHDDRELSSHEETLFFECVNRRAKEEPVAYITGEREFMSLKFKVDENVLIPRPDTEHLVSFAIDKINEHSFVSIADFCTGSGAIAISLAKSCPNTQVIGYDISDGALGVAEKNKEYLSADNVSFKKLDVLTALNTIENKFDMAVSNPPYIDKAEMVALDRTVYGYEPHLALFGGDDGLDFYRVMTHNAPAYLKKGGILAFEVGHTQAHQVKSLMENNFINTGIIKDYAGVERVVYGQVK